MGGVDRIAGAFTSCKKAGRAAFMPYLTLGFPSMAESVEVAKAAAAAGADLIELGVPFSDPLADGPTIQRSTQRSLDAGTTVASCLDAVQEIRAAGVTVPLLLMGYVNPLLSFGVERYARAAAAAGADGLIVPDLPFDEAGSLEAVSAEEGLALVYLAAPTTEPARLAEMGGRTRGFLYLVSVAGTTGARKALPADLGEFIARARRACPLPVAVGFGISDGAQAREVGGQADGVIIGSAFVDAVAKADAAGKDCARAAGEYCSSISAALGN